MRRAAARRGGRESRRRSRASCTGTSPAARRRRSSVNSSSTSRSERRRPRRAASGMTSQQASMPRGASLGGCRGGSSTRRVVVLGLVALGRGCAALRGTLAPCGRWLVLHVRMSLAPRLRDRRVVGAAEANAPALSLGRRTDGHTNGIDSAENVGLCANVLGFPIFRGASTV